MVQMLVACAMGWGMSLMVAVLLQNTPSVIIYFQTRSCLYTKTRLPLFSDVNIGNLNEVVNIKLG
jgi:hypothetical protein